MELQKFQNEEFGNLRTIEEDGKIMFMASDVAKMLRYAKPANAIAVHCRYALKRSIPHPQGKGTLEVNFIPEGDVYRLITHSKLPAAEKFESWVFDEVLPSIRKTGSYSRKASQTTPAQENRSKAMLLNAQSRQCKLWLQLAATTDLPDYKHICQQKAAEALTGESVLPMQEAEQKTYSATEIGKQLGVTAHKIGLLANKHSLKNETYGKYFYDKSAYSNKQVETFRYYPNAIDKFKELLGGAAK